VLIAADTNVLLDLASEVETVTDAVGTICRRLREARFVVPPTVLHELALAVRGGETGRIGKTAFRALSQLRAWGFEPLNLVPVGHGIVERIAEEIRRKDLLPTEEKNDALIIAESALLECRILLSGDAHLRGVDFQRLTLLLKNFDVAAPVIATPREIVRKFCR
jgi:predicted nucleic acid-binding protein